MPFPKVLSTEIVDHRNKTMNYELKTQNCKTKGFTLIELLIVISIFGLTASLITASYLTFERNQRLKAAAQKIKTDIRFTQNKALTGDKGLGSDPCVTPNTLFGWYISFSSEISKNTYYTIAGDCQNQTSGGEVTFAINTQSLPQGVQITKITYGSDTADRKNVWVLFEPLKHDVTFFSSALSDDVPPFLDNDGNFRSGKLLVSLPGEKITIQLAREKTYYYVDVQPSGEVYERQQ